MAVDFLRQCFSLMYCPPQHCFQSKEHNRRLNGSMPRSIRYDVSERRIGGAESGKSVGWTAHIVRESPNGVGGCRWATLPSREGRAGSRKTARDKTRQQNPGRRFANQVIGAALDRRTSWRRLTWRRVNGGGAADKLRDKAQVTGADLRRIGLKRPACSRAGCACLRLHRTGHRAHVCVLKAKSDPRSVFMFARTSDVSLPSRFLRDRERL